MHLIMTIGTCHVYALHGRNFDKQRFGKFKFCYDCYERKTKKIYKASFPLAFFYNMWGNICICVTERKKRKKETDTLSITNCH